MGKHSDKVGKYEDFRAPWETESGGDAEIDKGKLKRFIFNLKQGEAVALDKVDDANDAVTAAEKAVEDAKAEAAKASPEESVRKIAALEKANAELQAAIDKRAAEDKHEALRKEVIGDLDPKYAKYVVGDDKKSLEESLEQVKADFGVKDSEDDEEEEEEEEPGTLRTQPRSRLSNIIDPGNGKPAEREPDYDKVADNIIGAGRVFG